ncbi:MAG: hypothetical protein QOK21_327 [Solirubrobacteraceae bacterium]|nr:hypothetical protein [Solirubrobacteraceae bacterium]
MTATTRRPPRSDPGGITLSEPERSHAYIAAVQRDLNRHLRRLGAPAPLPVDGDWDDATQTAFEEICRVLGLKPTRTVRTFRLIAGAAASLTAAERAQAGTDGAAFEKELRKRFASAREHPLSAADRERAYVMALQRDLNRHLTRRGESARLEIDGEWDDATQAAFTSVCRALGMEPERTVRTYRLIAGAAAKPIRGKGERAVLGGPSMPRDERQRSYIAALQRDLNDHLVRLGSPAVLAVDGEWGEHTARSFKRVCTVLGVAAARNPRTYRIIAGALAARHASELARAKAEGAEFERKLRRHFAKQTVVVHAPAPARHAPVGRHQGHAPKPHPEPLPRPDGHHERVAAAIRRNGGRYEDHIIAASRRFSVPVALICAVLERETHFTNVFGHDAVRNPIKSPPGSNRPVTEALYRQYLGFRRQGLGCQGVGPMQLTSPFLQDAADKQGGAWKPGPNIHVGAAYLATCVRQGGGVRGGLTRYNGSSAYADAVAPLYARWQQVLGAASGVAAAAPQTLRLTTPRMTGEVVRAFQHVLNERLSAWRVPATLGEDGEFGPETRRAARQIAYGLGLGVAEYEHGITPAVRTLIATPSRRTASQRARAANRAGFRKKLRAQRHAVASAAGALLNGHRPPKPAAFGAIILEAHRRGLVVTSTNDGTHAANSFHYRDRAVDFGLPGPLIGTPQGAAMMVGLQRRLASRPHGFAEVFGPDNAACVKNGVRITLPEGTELENAHDNHVHVAI